MQRYSSIVLIIKVYVLKSTFITQLLKTGTKETCLDFKPFLIRCAYVLNFSRIILIDCLSVTNKVNINNKF